MAKCHSQYGDELLRQSATYLWNLVEKEFNVDEASRYTVTLNKGMFTATPASITLVLDTSARLASHVTEFTKSSWREIVDIFRQVGVAEYLGMR